MFEITDPNISAEKSVKSAVDSQGRINVDKVRRVKIDHAGAANMVIKHIGVVPMSIESRMIMTMRVMNPGIHHIYIAKEMKLSLKDVAAYELEGIRRCADHIKKLQIEESVKKFNMDKYETDSNKIKSLNLNPSNPLITGVNQNAADQNGA